MDLHYSDEIAAARPTLALHAMRPRVRSAAGTPEAARADLTDRPQVVVPAPPRVSRSLHSRASHQAIASLVDLQTG
jgi:hypothetical protein